MQQADALGYLWRLLWPTGLLALLFPEVLLLALPSPATVLTMDFAPMHQVWRIDLCCPIVPFVMVAMVEGVAKVAERRQNAQLVAKHDVEPRPHLHPTVTAI
ncbi:MAG: hypothetical protein R2867_30135 [Caldilineaceae bacterium]